jgi:tRNA (guanine37-N1)-methyltransferase
MNIDILTLFPKMFDGFLTESLIKRAIKNKIISVKIWDLRKFSIDLHGTVDDKPYGGGPGMVMKVDVIDKALSKLKKNKKSKIILLTPQGKTFNQKMAKNLSKNQNLIFICGHYEGFDERIRSLVDIEISIGDYVLTGGEIPAMTIIDSTVRLIPDVIGKKESLKEESFSVNSKQLTVNSKNYTTLLEYPQYTKPKIYKNKRVPKILLSGNHQKIASWRYEQALKKTQKRRPDLLK